MENRTDRFREQRTTTMAYAKSQARSVQTMKKGKPIVLTFKNSNWAEWSTTQGAIRQVT